MKLSPEGKRSSTDTQESLTQAIEAEISAGTFRPGDRLDERSLATRFGVSRTPIREALRTLATQGALEAKPHQGTFVPILTVAEILLAYELLGALEGLAAKLAARRATQLERNLLLATAKDCLKTAEAQDLAKYALLNLQFHEQMYLMSKNHVLEENSRRIRRALAPFRRMTFDLPGHMSVSAKEHVEVAEAIFAGNATEAVRLIENHLNINREDFRDLFIIISNALLTNERHPSPSPRTIDLSSLSGGAASATSRSTKTAMADGGSFDAGAEEARLGLKPDKSMG